MLSLRKSRLETLLKYFITNVHCTVIQYLIILSHTLQKGLYLLYSLLLLLPCIQEYFSQFIEKISVFLNSLTHNEKSVHFYQVLEDLLQCFHHCLWFWSSRSKNNDSFSYTLTTKLFLLDVADYFCILLQGTCVIGEARFTTWLIIYYMYLLLQTF